MAKKKTAAEKKDRAHKLNKYTALMMMSSPDINGDIIKALHQNTNFGENDLGEDIKMDFKTIIDCMERASKKVKNGDLSNLEEMLTCQTYALQNFFMTMASKAIGTTNADHIELLSRLALKAQNQCRTTIATLSEMKNPKRATFVKQLNQANQMQVNNGTEVDSENLKKNSIPATEQLEHQHGERLDTREMQEAIGAHQVLETVGEVDRSKDD